ncbi:MAG: hypothetical protein FWG70_11255 [Oscillospiraceae bacterium]|nr:hypothetical protein [Oscillospiraceae bacterium]
MTENVQTSAIMSAGMKVLRETLGVIEAEIFITNINRNQSDYTKWREDLWEDLTLHELLERAAKAEEKYGVPKGVQII